MKNRGVPILKDDVEFYPGDRSQPTAVYSSYHECFCRRLPAHVVAGAIRRASRLALLSGGCGAQRKRERKVRAHKRNER
jgi:hypothetical protein